MKPKYISAAILLIVAIVIGIFSYNTVWLGDDINYAFDFREDHRDEIVTSFTQIIQSMNAHYMTMNGRYVAHILVQYFCGIWGHLAFAIANATVYILFLVVLCRMCYVKMSNIRGVISVTLFALLVFQTKMVPSCQIGYIWTFTVVMIFVLLFFSQKSFSKWWQIILLGLFSVIAGNGNEALTIGVSGALIIYWFQNRHIMSLRQYIMMVCFGIGTMIICLSPAAHDRAARATGSDVYWLIGSVMRFFMTIKASFVLWIILLWKKYRLHMSFKTIYRNNAFLFNIWIIMLCFNAVIGFYINRQIFGVELVAIILSIRLLKEYTLTKLWMIVCGVWLMFLYVFQYMYIQKVREQYNKIESGYIESVDGTIYVDINNENRIPYSMEFSHTIQCYPDGYYEYTRDNLNKWLESKYKYEKKELRIIPTFLQNKEGVMLSTNVYCIDSKNDLYLVVYNKNDSIKLYVECSLNIPMINKEIVELSEIDMDKDVVAEGLNWQAKYVSLEYYNILHMGSKRLLMKSCDSACANDNDE